MSESNESWEDFSIDEEEVYSTSTADSDSEEGSSPNVTTKQRIVAQNHTDLSRLHYSLAGVVPDDNDNQDRLLNTAWCSCGHCVQQPLAVNCICCKEVEKTRTKMMTLEIDLDDANQCLASHDWFEAVCLHPGVLETAYLQYRAYYGRDAVEGTLDQKYRHVAYRQVVRWCWGYLGRFNRVPLPSCIINAIRRTFPNPNGQYKGFRYPPLD